MALTPALTRIRNNQVYNSDIYADSKVVAKSISGGLLSDNFTYVGNMTIGNLTVNGNTTTLDTTNLVIADPMFSINRNATGVPAYDLGMIMGRGSSTNVAFIWEENAQQFQLQYTTQSTASTTFGIINNSGFANLQVYGLAASNATIGSASITTLNTSSTITSSGNIWAASGTASTDITSGALVVTGGAGISGQLVVGTGLGLAGNGTIYTSNTTATVFNTVSTTVNAFQAATALSMGATTGSLTLRNPTIVSSSTAVTLFNTVATTMNFAGAATTLIAGATTGTAYLRNPTILGNNATQSLFNTVATTLNFGGAATSLNMGAATGQATINNPTLTLPNTTQVLMNGTNPTIDTSSTGTASIFNANATTVNIGGAATTVSIGADTGTTTVNNDLKADSFTSTGGGQHIGYITGAIGANTPNTGAFTTVTTSGAITAQGTISAPTINAGTIGNTGAAITASTATLTGTANSYGSGQGALQITGGFYAGGDSYIAGNLIVGNITSTGFNQLIANAPLLYLTANAFSTYNYEIGFYSNKVDNAYEHTGLVRNHLDNAWYLFSNIGTEPTSTIDLANASIVYDTLILGNVVAWSGNTSTSKTTGAVVVYGGIGAQGNIYAGAIQNTPIGNGTASTGAFTTLTTSSTIVSQGTITGAGQVIGYHTGAIGANTANTGAFTTITTTGTITSQGTISAPTVNAGTIGNTGAVFTGATLSTTSTITAQGTVSAPTVNAGTIGNTGAVFTGASQTLTGNVTAQNINVSNAATVGYLIANSGTASTGTTSGALIVQGGAGVTGDLNIGGNINGAVTKNVPTSYTSNIYPYANAGNINLYPQLNTNVTVNANQIVANLVVHGNSAAGYQNLLTTNGATGQVGIKVAPSQIVGNTSLQINGTDSMIIPTGAQANRPSNAQQGMIRFNTNSSQLEFYTGTTWSGTGTAFTIITADQFVGDGSQTNFTLSQSTTTAGTLVSINGVIQLPTTAYSVSGTTLTFTEAPLSTDIIDARALTTTGTVTSITDATGGNTFVANANGSFITAVNTTQFVANSAGNFFGTGSISTLSPNVSLSPNVPTIIDSFDMNVFRGAKYVISVSDYTNNNFQMSEVILVTGVSNATVQTYGVVAANGTSISNFYANVSGTTARLYANASVTSFAKVQEIYIPK